MDWIFKGVLTAAMVAVVLFTARARAAPARGPWRLTGRDARRRGGLRVGAVAMAEVGRATVAFEGRPALGMATGFDATR